MTTNRRSSTQSSPFPILGTGTRPYALLILCALTINAQGGKPPTAPATSFRNDVAPILVLRCLACHNDRKSDSGLSLTTVRSLKRGGHQTGEAIIEPHNPDASYLIDSIRPGAGVRMPFKQPPLSEKEIATLINWVNEGALVESVISDQTPIASLVNIYEHLPKVPRRAPVVDPITSVAFSPAGRTLAAAVGPAIQLFDPRSAKAIATLSGDPGSITALKFTPDGRSLVAVGGRPAQFGSIAIWNLSTQHRQFDLRGHSDSILAADLTADGRTLATASYDKQIRIWDIATGKLIRTLQDHSDSVYSLAFSPDAKQLASCSADRTVKLWQWLAGIRSATLSDATAELYSVLFTPDGQRLIAAGVDRSLRSYRFDQGKPHLEHSTFAHDAPIIHLAISPDGNQLASSAEDGSVRLWNPITLGPIASLPNQSDWTQGLAFSPDSQTLALGRFDGSLQTWNLPTQKPLLTLRHSPALPAQPPAPLSMNATLDPLSPRGLARGHKQKFILTGRGVHQATSVLVPEPDITASILRAQPATPNRLEIELAIAPEARVGSHSLSVLTPLGIPAFQSLIVEADPEIAEMEPNDQPPLPKSFRLPATLSGTIDRPGDSDLFAIDAKPGDQMIFKVMAKSLGSTLRPALAMVNDAGEIVSELPASPPEADPVFTYIAKSAKRHYLRVTDRDYSGSPTHSYRIAAGRFPCVQAVFPLAVSSETRTTVELEGFNLASKQVSLQIDRSTPAGTILNVPTPAAGQRPTVSDVRVVVADGAQLVEQEPAAGSLNIQRLAVPGGVSGRIDQNADIDVYQFDARKDQPVVIELFADRLGSDLDSIIEILDANGHAVPRAILRVTDQTELAFRDHNSTVPGIRMTHWENLAINDYLLFGRELVRIRELPRNLDDDCSLWSHSGRRLAMLETTPAQHPQAQPIYKVEIHPPNAAIPQAGVATVTLNYANDDAGPGFLRDSQVSFTPPRDGSYRIQVKDVRGLGGRSFAYHLVLRHPNPSYELILATENINVARGGTELLNVQIVRHDGMNHAIDLSALDLPPGISATGCRIQAGELTGTLAFTADPSAPTFSQRPWRIVSETLPASKMNLSTKTNGDQSAKTSIQTRAAGLITVTSPPNLNITVSPREVVIQPGKKVTLLLNVDREAAFTGRIPIAIVNLPQGVRVLDIGLNGILITEKQTQRSVTLLADSWVGPIDQPFYAVGKAEAAATSHSSHPVRLKVLPNHPTNAPP